MKYSLTDTIPITTRYDILMDSVVDPQDFMSVLRSRFKKAFWMECNDIYNKGERVILIAADPLAGIQVDDLHQGKSFKGDTQIEFSFDDPKKLGQYIDKWMAETTPKSQANSPYNGFMGYSSYNTIQLSESISLDNYSKEEETEIPLLKFNLYRYLFVFRKKVKEIILVNNHLDDEIHEISNMKKWLESRISLPLNGFKVQENADSDCTDEEFLNKVEKAKDHCRMGDVFQVVLSRKFYRAYKGDSWTFFTQLKKKDLSSYQFFLDEIDFQIAGTSPEIHFQAVGMEGCINPIAGTYRRSDNAEEERRSELQLLNDPKENSEHVMLVDLARNDLNKIASGVHVSQYKKIEKYAHVMHIVSQVKGQLPMNFNPFQSIMDVFPAGTLSGAPKFRAMQIIDDLENSSRSFYGGFMGWIGFNKDINTCILIRSVLFKDHKLTYRAGAGIVQCSIAESELEEVNNKLRSITTSLSNYQVPTL